MSDLPAALERPRYDPRDVRPGIAHIGVGGFQRAHLARYAHDLMSIDPAGLGWGLVAIGLRAEDRGLIETLNAQDGLYTLAEREGGVQHRVVIGSIVTAIDASASAAGALAAIDNPDIRIVTVTVTEHGYCLDRAAKTLDRAHPTVQADVATPLAPRSMPGLLVEAYRRRREAGAPAFTALSCDNIQRNGDVLRSAVLDLAALTDPALADWISETAGFPSAMVDRITPKPTAEDIAAFAAETGVDDRAALSAEVFRQWVIEDRFVAGRPAWDKVGAEFVSDVTPHELMKLRLLNASHLAVAALGQLAGHARIDEAMGDPRIRRYMVALMDSELEPTLEPVPGADLPAYKRALVSRFANAAVRDTTQRVNTDAPINVLLDPIRDRLDAGQPADLLALGLAAWLRRTCGAADDGRPIEIVHPMADRLAACARAGGPDPTPLLSIEALFGDLGRRQGFVAVVGGWLAALSEDGVSKTLERAAARGQF